MEITHKYLLIRTENKTARKTIILQSNDRSELQHFKGKIETEISIDDFVATSYSIEVFEEYESKIQNNGIF